MSPAQRLAALIEATAVDFDQLPRPVTDHVTRLIADTVGVSLAGHRGPQLRALRAAMAGDGAGVCTVWSPGWPGAPAPAAAYLNATAGSFLELDAGMRPTGHPAMQVVPAAFAVAQSAGVPGRRLIEAVVSGYEVSARLFRACRLAYPVHPHGHLGAIGAAVAAARLLGADPVGPALIAATSPVLSVWPACYDGATARNTWMGLAARSGVESVTLAAAGFTGSPSAFDSVFAGFAAELTEPDALTAAFDPARPAVLTGYLKVHSACSLTHSALDAVASLQLPPAETITEVEVETVSASLKLDRQAQPNELSTRFSLPYAVSAAILRGSTTDPAAFAWDPRVAELAARVTVRGAPDLDQRWPDAAPAKVTVRGSAGTVQAQVDNPRGYGPRALSPGEVRGKFLALAGQPGPDLWERLTALAEWRDCASLFDGIPAGDA